MAATPPLAGPPRIPRPSSAQRQAQAEHVNRRSKAEGRERRSMVRGLIVLAVLVLLLSIARAGLDRVFPNGWWKL
jgi:hypothetical protein